MCRSIVVPAEGSSEFLGSLGWHCVERMPSGRRLSGMLQVHPEIHRYELLAPKVFGEPGHWNEVSARFHSRSQPR